MKRREMIKESLKIIKKNQEKSIQHLKTTYRKGSNILKKKRKNNKNVFLKKNSDFSQNNSQNLIPRTFPRMILKKTTITKRDFLIRNKSLEETEESRF